MCVHLFEVVFESERLLALPAELSPYVLFMDLFEYDVPPLADVESEFTTLHHTYIQSDQQYDNRIHVFYYCASQHYEMCAVGKVWSGP